MKLFRDPLVHFLLLGAGFFLLYSLVNNEDEAGSEKDEIVVTQGRLLTLKKTYEKVWSRPPSEKELEGLVADFVKEEVYYREALAMRLEKDDTIIRRRLRLKLEFLSNDLMTPTEASDEVLLAYLKLHEDSYLVESTLSLRQVFFSIDKRGDSALSDVETLLAELRLKKSERSVDEFGDSTLLVRELRDAEAGEVRRVFGHRFAKAVAPLPVGEWHGPIRSGFGIHLVYVSDRVEERLPELSDIRAAVFEDWKFSQQQEANEAFYAKMLEQYDVRIEGEDRE